MNAAKLLVNALEAEGVRYIFGVPGEENLDFVDALRDSSIQLIVTRHEQGAGFMAATYGRLTGKMSVALSTLGPGATNLVTAAAYAQLGGMPMMMLTGQKPIRHAQQALFQLVDVVGMMRPLTKFTRQFVSAHEIPAWVREACRLAQGERPGAVHIELPEDIAREDATQIPLLPIAKAAPPVATREHLRQVCEVIRQAKHPLLMVGAGANRQDTAPALRAFAEKIGIPFFTTQMGKGALDESSPLWLGNATLTEGDFVHQAIEHADVIINIGHDVTEKPPFRMDRQSPIVVHINAYPAEIDSVYAPQWELVGHMDSTLQRMTVELAPQLHWDFRFFEQVREALSQQLNEHADAEDFPMHPVRIVHDTRAVMPDDGIICLDNGWYKIWFARYYRAHQPNTLLLDNALATMGAGLPSAIMAKMVYPERKVLAVCGDGGFMMNAQELQTAVELKLDLVIMVVRDDSYGMIRWKQYNMGYSDYGMQFTNPDFVAFAQAHGAQGHRPTCASELAPLLQQAFEQGGVHLIDVPINYADHYHIIKDDIRLRAQALQALRG